MIENLRKLQKLATENANKHGWKVHWNRENILFQKGDLTVGEAIALICGELSGEAMEEYRNNNKLKFAIEMADAIIRELHLCGDVEIDILDYIIEKMQINKDRSIIHGHEVF